jgi:hypothetical protein
MSKGMDPSYRNLDVRGPPIGAVEQGIQLVSCPIELVSQTFANWNLIGESLRRLESFRKVAQVCVGRREPRTDRVRRYKNSSACFQKAESDVRERNEH